MIWKRSVVLAGLMGFQTLPAAAEDITLQDMQVVGRAISFVEGAKRQQVSLAVVFDPSSPASVHEMEAVLASLGRGVDVGGRVLSAVAVEQGRLGSARPVDAVFSTVGVDQDLLRGHLQRSGTPCFTVTAAQVRDGACIVAIRSRPSVSISFSSRNASAAGVRFATAFIMMVREL